MKSTVSTGKTLDAAVEHALKELGLARDQVEVKVLQEGGFLKSYKVEVTEIEAEIVPEETIDADEVQAAIEEVATEADNGKPNAQTAKIKEFLANVLEKMGITGVTVQAKEVGDVVALTIVGDNATAAIGHRGEVLDALQYLSSLLLSEHGSGFRRVTVDAEGYRGKREKTLQRLAQNLEQKVKRTGKPVNLEPMNPYERRIIHTTLQNSKYVTTESDGQGNQRHVVIRPVSQSNVLNSPNAPRKTLNFVYRSDKKRRK